MFECIDQVTDVLGDGLAYVELYPSWYANKNQQTREEVVTQIAALSYGNDAAKDPKALYDMLWNSKHSSVFEFVFGNMTDGGVYLDRDTRNLREYRQLAFNDSRSETVVKATNAIFKMKVPVFVFRQMVRHRQFATLEMSRRYVKDTKRPFEFYKYEDDKEFYDLCIAKYHEGLYKGMKAQEARKYIPVGMYTELYWANTYNSVQGLKRFFDLRLDEQHTQPETVKVARAMYRLVNIHQPELARQVEYKGSAS